MAVRHRCVSGLRGIVDSGWPGNVCGGLVGARVTRAASDSALDGRHGRRGGGECAGGGCARPRCPLLWPELRTQQLNLRGRFGTDRLVGDGPHPWPQVGVTIRQRVAKTSVVEVCGFSLRRTADPRNGGSALPADCPRLGRRRCGYPLIGMRQAGRLWYALRKWTKRTSSIWQGAADPSILCCRSGPHAEVLCPAHRKSERAAQASVFGVCGFSLRRTADPRNGGSALPADCPRLGRRRCGYPLIGMRQAGRLWYALRKWTERTSSILAIT